MKLYTEEQLRKTWNEGFRQGMSIDDENYEPVFFEHYLKFLIPIELPSDEEIEEIAFRRVNGLTDYLTPKELNCLREGYMNGMKLLINVIQGGNK